jgi:hypothetical protein
VATIGTALVHYYSLKVVDVLLWVRLLKSVMSVRCHVKFERELASIVDFDLDHHVKIKLETFQYQDQLGGQSFDAHTFNRVDLLITFLAMISIISL